MELKTRGRIYISGPMRGMPDLNHATFDAVDQMLTAQQWTVHSPAKTNREHGHTPLTPYSECIRLDVQSLLDSDAICLLPGWEQSEGARFEVEVAKHFGLTFFKAEMHDFGNGDSAWNYVPTTVQDQGAEGPDQEARRLVYGERAATYGHPRGDFECIGGMWAAMVGARVKFWAFQNKIDLPAIPFHELINEYLVASMMTALKLARQVKSPEHRDTMVDIIGYQLCMARLNEAPSEMRAWQARSEAILAATAAKHTAPSKDDAVLPEERPFAWHAGQSYSHLDKDGLRHPSGAPKGLQIEEDDALDEAFDEAEAMNRIRSTYPL